MVETLLTPSSIKMFGRTVAGLSFDPSATPLTDGLGGNLFLRNQFNAVSSITVVVNGPLAQNSQQVPLNVGKISGPVARLLALRTAIANSTITDANGVIPPNTSGQVLFERDAFGMLTKAVLALSQNPKADAAETEITIIIPVRPQLARIYAVSFEGGFYALPRPPLFLVHGPGLPTGNWASPSTLDQSGVAGREWDFSGNGDTDLVYWEYEKGDFSLRLDLEAGQLDQILLPLIMRGGGMSGAGVSGAGVSGAGVSGAGVSGAGVSGAGVSGAGVSGAGVSGAGLRR